MQLKHTRSLVAPVDGIAKITAIAWSPNNARLAVVTADRVVHLFDENGEKRDKFSTKPADKGPKNYVVTGLAWSPDSSKLAIAQSDCIVFVYKLGLDWTDKKSICNKFPQTAPVSAVAWPSSSPNDLVFGTRDGKVRLGSLRTGKSSTLYATDSYVTALACSPDGRGFVSSHIDGSVWRCSLDEDGGAGGSGGSGSRLFIHTCPASALAWGYNSILAAGADGRVVLYDSHDGSPLRAFEGPSASDDSGIGGAPAMRGDHLCAAAAPGGDVIAVGGWGCLQLYTLETPRPSSLDGSPATASGAAAGPREWCEAVYRSFEGMYGATALAWKPDGTRLVVGNMTGAADVFESYLRRQRACGGAFEYTFTSPSSVIVKRVASGARTVLRSSFGLEIRRIRVYQDQYLVAATDRTLLVGDMDTCRLSEVPWTWSAPPGAPRGAAGAAAERFYFDCPSVCVVYRAGEMVLVEYGRTAALGACRTEHMSPHTVSVRIGERRGGSSSGAGGEAGGAAAAGTTTPVKVVAYLLDAQTVAVVDLLTGAGLATLTHDSRIDWLELSHLGDWLLLRDRRRRLFIYEVRGGGSRPVTLLPSCGYAQWVPDSDVPVAQRRSTVFVWYALRGAAGSSGGGRAAAEGGDVHGDAAGAGAGTDTLSLAIDRPVTFEVKGDVIEIERDPASGRTEIIVEESGGGGDLGAGKDGKGAGALTRAYPLDDTLISFGGAIDAGDLARALASLELVEASAARGGDGGAGSSLESMWQQLGQAALAGGDLVIAERCAIATGDVARARFLRQTRKTGATLSGGAFSASHWAVRARLAVLRGDFATAESTYLDRGRPADAVEVYQSVHLWEDAVAVAEAQGLPDAGALRARVMQYLLDSGQEDRAAALKERNGDTLAAAALYLRAGYPARAAGLVAANPTAYPREAVEKVVAALVASGMWERAGALLERLGDSARALESYIRGNAFRPAVELARRAYPARVVELERAWGDWLVANRQPDVAVGHYIEAGAPTQAISAALDARQFARAAQLVKDTLGDAEKEARPFLRRIAAHWHERGSLEEAEKFYLAAGDGRACVDMYMAASRWEAAHRVAKAVMPPEEATKLYVAAGQAQEAAGHLRQAERLFVTVGAVDAAVAMYKRARQWDALIRLVSSHRPGALHDTHVGIARQCASEGATRQAEAHYVAAGEWEAAVGMYRQASEWEEAVRVARAHGGAVAAGRVLYAQASSLGGDLGVKLLAKHGLLDAAIDFAVESRLWDHALDLAARHAPEKASFVHLKRGNSLEDEGNFAAAEVEFVAAGRPREAIDMFLHARDWASALRVAENHDPGSVADVLVAQANAAAASRDWATAEALLIDARRPDLAVEMYLHARSFPEALRVTKRHLAHKLAEVNDRIKRAVATGTSASEGVSGGGGAAAAASAAGGGSRRGDSQSSTAGSSAGADILDMARQFERAGDWVRCIDSYLAVGTPADPRAAEKDPGTLEGAWMTAVSLAQSKDRGRAFDVCEEVAHRLADIGRWAKSGDLFLSIDQPERAAEAYAQAGDWAKARTAAKAAGPRVREAVEAAAAAAGGGSSGGEAGGEDPALDKTLATLAAGKQWEKLFETAARAGPAALARYLYPRVEELVAGGGVVEAVTTMSRYGAPPLPQQMGTFRRVVAALLGGTKTAPLPTAALHEAREVMYKLVSALRKTSAAAGGDPVVVEFDKLLLLTHYASMRARLSEQGLHELVAKLSVSMLRFAGPLLPADRAFYEAGTACKQAAQKGPAFVLLNRYVDLADAIDDGGDATSIDNSDFAGSGIPQPVEYGKIGSHWVVPVSAREEVREWVLSVSLDQRVERSLPVRPCPTCGAKCFEGALGCPVCKATFPACVITGYPIPAAQAVTCGACSSKALKPAWNAVVAKTKACPWCAAPASPNL